MLKPLSSLGYYFSYYDSFQVFFIPNTFVPSASGPSPPLPRAQRVLAEDRRHSVAASPDRRRQRGCRRSKLAHDVV